jgi:glycosyltransferase involved in cell wall biosynthesis
MDRGHRIVPFLSPYAAPLGLVYEGLLKIAEEVWAPSSFAVDLVRLSSIVPTILVPWPAAPPGRSSAAPASSVGGQQCTFLSIIDCQGDLTWDNPFATIAAFRDAFQPPERGSSAQLVVGASHLAASPEAARRLREDVAAVSGTLVEDPDEEQIRSLLQDCDVFVSLHRGTPFGLRLADAVALGKATLATGYSGNLDYMTHQNGCLVGYGFHRLHPGDFYLEPNAEVAYVPEQMWAEPDLDDAARWMRRLARDADLRHRLACVASERGASLTSGTVGESMRTELARVTWAAPRRRLERRRRVS